MRVRVRVRVSSPTDPASSSVQLSSGTNTMEAANLLLRTQQRIMLQVSEPVDAGLRAQGSGRRVQGGEFGA